MREYTKGHRELETNLGRVQNLLNITQCDIILAFTFEGLYLLLYEDLDITKLEEVLGSHKIFEYMFNTFAK